MDFGDLLLLLFLLAPLLRRFFGKKKTELPEPPPGTYEPGEDRPVPASDNRVTEDDPLSEALRQIREALGDPVEERKPEPEPAPAKPRSTLPKRPAPGRSLPKPEPEFRGLGAFEHEEHGFGLSNPLSEETFERRPAQAARSTFKAQAQKKIARVDLSTPLEVRKLGAELETPGVPTVADQLKNPQKARDAFVFGEIFGPPRSKRRSIR